MPFSHMTRWLRDRRTPLRGSRTQLRVELMEDRRTPAASLLTTNATLTGAADSDSQLVAVATNGRYAIFTSTATNVVAGQVDSPSTKDLFWVDTLTGEKKLVTAKAGSGGTIATGQVGGGAVISGDGLSVAFVSNINAATYDTNYPASADAGNITDDVFLWSSATGTTTLASRLPGNIAVGQSTNSANPAISANGSIVAFTTTQPTTSFINGGADLSNTIDLFRFQTSTNTVDVVSQTSSGPAFGKFADVVVDPLGRYMDASGTIFAFISSISADKVDSKYLPTPAQLKNVGDVYQGVYNGGSFPTYQLVTSVVTNPLKSLSVTGGRATSAIIAPNNPQAVVFGAVAKSGFTNELVTGYTNNNGAGADLYFRLMNSFGGNPTLLVSAAGGTTNSGGDSELDPRFGSFVISSDGSRVVFTSSSTNLTPTVNDTNNGFDVYTWSYTDQVVRSASVAPGGTVAGNDISYSPSVSADGRYVTFETAATNLTASSDINTVTDVVVRDLISGTNTLASSVPNGSFAGNGRSSSPMLIGSGTNATVIFNSYSTNIDPLFPNTTFGPQFVFSRNLPITTSPVSTVAVVSGQSIGSSSSASIVTFNNNGLMVFGNKFTPFPGFSGELRVAEADVDGDGTADMVVGAGPGGGPRVVVISGASGKVIRDFYAYEPTFFGGVYVAAGDFNADGKADLVVGADAGGGPRVRIFSAGNVATPIADFYVYETTFTGGVRVAVGDVNGDGTPDLVCGAGFGGGPRVSVISGTTLGVTNTRLADFFAFENSLRNGVFVSAGDVDGDGKADLGIGAGPSGGPRITVFDGTSVISGNPAPTQLLNFFAFDSSQRNGVHVAIKNIDGDATGDIMAAQGVGGTNNIRTFSGGKISTPNMPLLIQDTLLNGNAGSVLGAWVG